MTEPGLSAKQVVERWVARDQTAERYPHLKVALDVLLRQFEHQEMLIGTYVQANEQYLIRIRQLERAALMIFDGPVDEMSPEKFQLYRVFDFGRGPRVFVLPGALRRACQLEPTQYLAATRTDEKVS